MENNVNNPTPQVEETPKAKKPINAKLIIIIVAIVAIVVAAGIGVAVGTADKDGQKSGNKSDVEAAEKGAGCADYALAKSVPAEFARISAFLRRRRLDFPLRHSARRLPECPHPAVQIHPRKIPKPLPPPARIRTRKARRAFRRFIRHLHRRRSLYHGKFRHLHADRRFG